MRQFYSIVIGVSPRSDKYFTKPAHHEPCVLDVDIIPSRQFAKHKILSIDNPLTPIAISLNDGDEIV